MKPLRFPKSSGSKKLNGWCPADLRVTEDHATRMVYVKVQSTHVGHSTTSKSEVSFVSLDKKEKCSIADKLLAGVEERTLYQTYQKKLFSESFPRGPLQRKEAVTYDDIYNVSRKQKNTSSDADNVAKFLFENERNILFYKREKCTVTTYPKLSEDDFVLVYMDQFQEELLRKFGGNVLAYNSTHGTNSKDFMLHTLLVLDENWIGIGVAFMLTNRNDAIVLEVFLDSIKKKAGVLAPNSLMTDMQPSFFNAFNEVMGQPKCWLWCIWHVFEKWRQHQKKVPVKDKRKRLMKELYQLTQETDKHLFEQALEKFLHNSDPDLKTFIEYFQKYYVPHVQHWAYCYRVRKHINTNMCLEAFHRTIKRSLFGNRRKKKTVEKCLHALETYINIHKRRRYLQDVQPRRNTKLRNLRSRHHTAVKFQKDVVVQKFDEEEQTSDASCWLVTSFPKSKKERKTTGSNDLSGHDIAMYYCGVEDDNEDDLDDEEDENGSTHQLYVVQQQSNFKKGSENLICEFCDISFSQFSCTCTDYLVCNNMCKHIHVVGLALKNTERELGNYFLLTGGLSLFARTK
jgi:hypothetical protein